MGNRSWRIGYFYFFCHWGFQYITSLGDPAKLADAKDRIKSAFFGLILLVGSFVILNTINPQLLTFQTSPFATTTLNITEECTDAKECEEKCNERYPQNPTECKKYTFSCINNYCVTQRKTCEFVTLYTETNFKGQATHLNVGETYGEGWSGDASKIKSIRAGIIDKGSSQRIYFDQDGGGCSVQFFNRGFLDFFCGDLISTAPGYIPDVAVYIDRPVKCIKVVGPSTTTSFQIPSFK